MDIDLCMQRIAAAADVIAGLTCYPYVPDAFDPPCFYTADVKIDYDSTFGGDPDVELICRAMTSHGDDLAGQRLLLQMMAPTGDLSIKAALEAARGAPGVAALGGACDDLYVSRVQGHRIYINGESKYYGAEWVIRLIGDGD